MFINKQLIKEEEIADLINTYIQRNSSDYDKKPWDKGVFNYETYNEVLRANNPNVIPTIPLPLSWKTLQTIVQHSKGIPVVQEIDASFTYEDLSVMVTLRATGQLYKQPPGSSCSMYQLGELNAGVSLGVDNSRT
ncbi:hypothetical protein DICVIV_01917 [Dictyocaulus viviparus]|uniref:Uncharacterized protein n=1 Tax=Dictyocaulus viviparus TaxID=29172 RepID=A0A0D8YBK3_DICVI|nr:hypothetical protein DICVIV_01917 [Dictyocaulus viviparus]